LAEEVVDVFHDCDRRSTDMQQSDTIINVLTRIAGRVESTRPATLERPACIEPRRICERPPDSPATPAAIIRYVRLPDKLENGNFDEFGRKLGGKEPAALSLYELPGGPWQCWGVFDKGLEPGQYGFLVFDNVKGQAAPGGAFTEWNREESLPFFTERLLRIFSVQRAPGRARIIGRNDSRESVAAAAGLLFVPPPEAPPPKHDPHCPRRQV
jgi:hypothetical protein